MSGSMLTAKQVQELFKLQPLEPEGGYFAETFRSPLSSAIYYMLTPETFSELHRLPTDEVFHFYLGGPVRMLQLFPDGAALEVVIGADILAGERPQVVVPAGVWQGSRVEPGAAFALLGATMAPGFDYADYEEGRRSELIGLYPDHARQIERLTRSCK